MGAPLVSVIMGAYNCEDCIAQCIDSVIAQTYSNWEFIICDDCSTDSTADVLSRYAKNDQRIIVIRNEQNSKLAASLNRCLEYARGEFVARMDADDICLPERFEKQVEFLLAHDEFAVVGSGAKILDGVAIVSERIPKELPTAEDVLKGTLFMHPTIMMRKKVYDQLGGYTVAQRTERGQDWDLWFRFCNAGYQGYNLQESLIMYHESLDDYKKRTMKTGWMYTRTALYGFKLLNVPIWKYSYAFKPLISAIIPDKLVYAYHNRKHK